MSEEYVITSYSIHYTKLYESDYWRLADIDDVLREVSNSSFDFQFSDLLKQRKEEYRNFVKESYPSYYLEKRKELAQITQNEYFGEISSEEYVITSYSIHYTKLYESHHCD